MPMPSPGSLPPWVLKPSPPPESSPSDYRVFPLPPLGKDTDGFYYNERWIFGFEMTNAVITAFDRISGKPPVDVTDPSARYMCKSRLLDAAADELHILPTRYRLEDGDIRRRPCLNHEDLVVFATATKAKGIASTYPGPEKVKALCEKLRTKLPEWIQIRTADMGVHVSDEGN
ncbi:hypothetical protein C8J56DRAFT_912131 [Mycena floridula]|nr:hypothetical protein C8J56DRAFT_912131 [Mycena floridula]